jgi:acyl-[acyl-carrier-protein]-phospholipid O-acyltransferase/long-chain-fatty-acid--[acyl-carrier-protein] ligase
MFDSLRLCVAGAEKLPLEVKKAFKLKFSKEIYEGYGTTETSPVISINLPDQIKQDSFKVQYGQKDGTVGLLLPGTFVKIVDPSTFEEANEGMIIVSGVQVMKGYYKSNTQTNLSIKTLNGLRYYITGDKGKIDKDGFLTIIDRYSRFAKIGGEMVSLSFVENEIRPFIKDDTLFVLTSIKDEKKGEKIVLLIEEGYDVDILKNDLKELKINPLYMPSQFKVVSKIPTLGSGKIDYSKIKTLAL